MTDNAQRASWGEGVPPRPSSGNLEAERVPPAQLADLLEHQYHVIARRQAKKYEMTDSALAHRLREGGPWQWMAPGVYSTTTGAVTSDQRQMAALLYAGKGAVLTGAWAVRRHGLTCAGGNDIEVLLPTKSRVKGAGYIRIRHTERMPTDTSSTRGIVFAPLVRAVADAARSMTRLDDVRALVSEVLQKGRCSLEELVAEVKAGPAARSGLLRAAIKELLEGIRSQAERDLKFRLERSDLDKPIYNARLYLRDGTFLGMVDTWWPRSGVAGEVDSRQYHMGAKDYAETMARHNRIQAAGVNLLHFLPKDIKPQWPIIYRDIRDAIANGKQKPPLPIIAVPPNVKDVKAYLITKLAA